MIDADKFYEAAEPGQWVYDTCEEWCVFRKGSAHDPRSEDFDEGAVNQGESWLFSSSEWSFVNELHIERVLNLLNEDETRERQGGEPEPEEPTALEALRARHKGALEFIQKLCTDIEYNRGDCFEWSSEQAEAALDDYLKVE